MADQSCKLLQISFQSECLSNIEELEILNMLSKSVFQKTAKNLLPTLFPINPDVRASENLDENPLSQLKTNSKIQDSVKK